MTQSRQAASLDYSEAAESTEIKKPNSTVAQSLITGSVAGGAEVFIDHPLWSIKTKLQSGEKFTFNPQVKNGEFTLNPRVLYRGILPNAASMIPITAIQVGLNRGFQLKFFEESKELSSSQRITCAFVAGVGSSLVSCPTEMVMTHQGKSGGSFYSAAKSLHAEGGWTSLWRGLAATAMREGMFTAFFLAGTPILKASIQPYCENDNAASLLAGMGGGIGATIASQGVDTLKTIQQSAPPRKPIHLKDAVKQTYSKQGVYGFFKGGIPRGMRVMSAVTIMGWINEKMEAEFQEYNLDKNSAIEKSMKK